MQRMVEEMRANNIAAKLSGISGLTEKTAGKIIRRMVYDTCSALGPGVYTKVKNSIFVIKQNNKDSVGRGIGIFISPTLAVTSNYVLDEVDDEVNIMAVLNARGEELMLTTKVRNAVFGYALLTCPGKHTHVDVWDGDHTQLVDERMALCTCLLPLSKPSARFFSTGVAVIAAHGITLTEDNQYLAYLPQLSPGGSGGALLTHGGQLIGMHAGGMSQLQELQDMEQEDQAGQITQVASALRDVNNSFESGYVAVLASTFKSS